MIEINGKIDAIKAIRSIKVSLVEEKNQYGTTIQVIKTDIGLKDAKDLVEAIVAMGDKQANEAYANLQVRYAELANKYNGLVRSLGTIYNNIDIEF